MTLRSAYFSNIARMFSWLGSPQSTAPTAQRKKLQHGRPHLLRLRLARLRLALLLLLLLLAIGDEGGIMGFKALY